MDVLTPFEPPRRPWASPLSSRQSPEDEQRLVQLESELHVEYRRRLTAWVDQGQAG